MSSLRRAAILGSSCRRDPAAAFRGLANGGCPASSRCSLRAWNTFLGINTSPRTMSRLGASSSTMGMERMVFRFSVTSSPTRPSPRVAPRMNFPSRYSSATDRPSTLGSTVYAPSGAASRTLASNSPSSSMEKTSCRLSRGTGCSTFSNWLIAWPPTRFVGDNGDASSGCRVSSSSSCRISRSYS